MWRMAPASTRRSRAAIAATASIFMLHSVVDDDAFYPEAMLRCPVGRLDWMLRWLKANGAEFVSLDEAIARLSEPQARLLRGFHLR